MRLKKIMENIKEYLNLEKFLSLKIKIIIFLNNKWK